MASEIVWNHENADHRRAFAQAIAPLVQILWKKKEPFSRVDAVIYMRTLKHVRTGVLVEAVDRMLGLEKWFPEPSTILRYCADIVDEKRKAACVKWLTDCVECDGSRWREVEIDGVARLDRCGCWKRAMREMHEAGEPLVRPALPAHVEPPTEI